MLDSKTEDELYAAIGNYVALQAIGSRPPTFSEIMAMGKRWVEHANTSFKSELCNSKLIKYAQLHPTETGAALAAVAAALVKFKIVDIDQDASEEALIAFSTLILKEGVDRYCGIANEQDSGDVKK